MAKEHRGGKYFKKTWGVKHWLHQNAAGKKREFMGSGSYEYHFEKEGVGILTIYADSYDEAKRIARSRGYKQYRKRGK